MPRPRAFRLGAMASLFANGVDPARAVGAAEASFIQFPLEPRPTDRQCNVVSDAKKVSAHRSIAVAKDTSTPQLRQDESSATGEERNEGKDGDHEQHRVDDHTTGDRDDEKDNAKNQKHEVALVDEVLSTGVGGMISEAATPIVSRLGSRSPPGTRVVTDHGTGGIPKSALCYVDI